MTKSFKRISAILLMAILMITTICTTAFAAASTVTYKGRKSGFEFAPGTVYTETDLFDKFKDVMPGDTRTEKVTIKNQYSGCDYIKVWIRAVPHDKKDNPVSDAVWQELKSRKASSTNAADQEMTELQYMYDFLDQFNLTVWNGEKTEKNRIYTGKASSFAEGNVYLGTIRYKKDLVLNAELEADLERMDNRYADRIGEVDWVFVIEERNDSNGGGGSGSKPSTTPSEKVEIIEQPEQLLPNLPKTGDDMVVWPYVMLLGLGVVGMVLTMFKKRKKEN